MPVETGAFADANGTAVLRPCALLFIGCPLRPLRPQGPRSPGSCRWPTPSKHWRRRPATSPSTPPSRATCWWSSGWRSRRWVWAPWPCAGARA